MHFQIAQVEELYINNPKRRLCNKEGARVLKKSSDGGERGSSYCLPTGTL